MTKQTIRSLRLAAAVVFVFASDALWRARPRSARRHMPRVPLRRPPRRPIPSCGPCAKNSIARNRISKWITFPRRTTSNTACRTSNSTTPKPRFGALRQEQRSHARTVRVVVRVGDYKQDSYYGPGVGVATLGPIDDDPIALRWQLWTATDSAYKAASEALAMKKAALRQYTADQPFDDFAHASAPRIHRAAREARFRSQALARRSGKIHGAVPHRSENSIALGHGSLSRREPVFRQYRGHRHAARLHGLFPERRRFHAGRRRHAPRTLALFHRRESQGIAHARGIRQANTAKMLETLKNLRDAPVVDEDYRGPVLFSADAASDVFNGMVGGNVLGKRPQARENPPAPSVTMPRITRAASCRTFLSVEDDPTLQDFRGQDSHRQLRRG